MTTLDSADPTGQVLPEVRTPEPRRHPLTEYWDVTTARWRRCESMIPAPRSGD